MRDIGFELDALSTVVRSTKVRSLLVDGADYWYSAEAMKHPDDWRDRLGKLNMTSAMIKAALLHMSYTGSNMDLVEPLARLLIRVEDIIDAGAPEPSTVVETVLETAERLFP